MNKTDRAIAIIIAAYIGGQMIRPFFQKGIAETFSDPSMYFLLFVFLGCTAIVVYNLVKLFKRAYK